MEASEEIQNLKQKLSIQMEKCNTFEVQQNVLMDILDIPPEKRNFLSLRECLENLKNDYVNEKERADNLACQMPIPQPSESRNVGLNTPMETPNRGPAVHSTVSLVTFCLLVNCLFTNSISLLQKTPVRQLEELYVPKGITPKYDFVQSPGL